MSKPCFVLLLVAIGSGSLAQKTERPKVAISVAGPVNLQLQPDIFPGNVVALPRIAVNETVSTETASKINAALSRDDARVRTAAVECREGFRESRGKTDPSAWQRSIELTMRGPRFLAFMVTDSYYCGGTYPNDGMRMPLVYDLTTGAPVNWLKLLPATTVGSTGTASDGSIVGLIEWSELTKLSKGHATKECEDAFDESGGGLAYSLNLDARTGTLKAEPATFPHVIQACAETVQLDPAALRRLKVSEELIRALMTAHAAQKFQR